jgi:DNA-directed RNA polymerase specialized sigma24 family protein
MQTRTPLNAAAQPVGWRAPRLASGLGPAGQPSSSRGQTSGERRTRPHRAPGVRPGQPAQALGAQDLAQRLDEQRAAAELREGLVPAPASSASGLTPDGRRMLQAIGELPEDEREVFDLVWIQGMTQAEAAQELCISAATMKRRLSCGLQLLAMQLSDLRPGEKPPDTI